MKIRYPPSEVNNLDIVPLSWCITLHSPSVVTPLDYYAQGINLIFTVVSKWLQLPYRQNIIHFILFKTLMTLTYSAFC